MASALQLSALARAARAHYLRGDVHQVHQRRTCNTQAAPSLWQGDGVVLEDRREKGPTVDVSKLSTDELKAYREELLKRN